MKIRLRTKLIVSSVVMNLLLLTVIWIKTKNMVTVLISLVLLGGFTIFWLRLIQVKIKKSNFSIWWNGNLDIDLEHISLVSNSEKRLANLIHNLKARNQSNQQIVKDMDYLKSQIENYDHEMDQIQINIQRLNYELELNQKANQYLSEHTDHFIIELDGNGIIQKMNTLFETRLGYSSIESKGLLFDSFVQQTEYDQSFSIKALLNATEEPIFINVLYANRQNNASEYISFRTIKMDSNTFLCLGKSISDEIAIQSRIIRKKKELDYINQINSALISNRSVEELLENILKKLEGLFNMSFGCVYMRNTENEWDLKSFLSKKIDQSTFNQTELEILFDAGWLSNPDVRVVAIGDSFPMISDYAQYIAMAPLQVDGRVIAILCSGLGSKMNLNDYNILKMFNNQASIVVQRAIIYEKLRVQYFNTIEALVSVIEAKDKYTEGHSRRVSRFAVEIAKEMGYSSEEIENVEISGLLHDVGKIGINQEILVKRGKLTVEEYEEMKQHPEKGIQILDSINLRKEIKEGILYHHLRYDLSGYPKSNLNHLPPFAAIIGAADAFDAMTSARSYSQARTMEDSMNEIIRYKGRQFDPEVVSVLEQLIRDKRHIIQKIIDDEQGESYVISSTLQTVATTGL